MYKSTFPTRMAGWFQKYKLHHIPFWIGYNYLWWVVAMGNPFTAANNILFTPLASKFIFYLVFQTLAVYFNLYYLIPKFLEKGHFVTYILCLLATIAVTASLIVPGYHLGAYIAGMTLDELYGKANHNLIHMVVGGPLSSTIAVITLAMSIKLTKNWLQTRQRQQALEKEKLETELNFLKYQFNPHFLFNSINSIFFLIHKDPDVASASLAKFSELLRHQLYECNDHEIPLSKEITYLENFIELEKLRQNENIRVTFELESTGTEPLGIAPFILMTFLENAFKHVSKHHHEPNWIDIKLSLTGQKLDFWIANSTSADGNGEVVNYGGIGLKNVRRRLDLIYPGKYELRINDEPGHFEVHFTVMLEIVVLNQEAQIA
ncbi:sensor histidine kinase [Dyadobacter sp. CY323]|uniref:sensor histidine kinase n=1 Tax=Dyadobacter sp. CY323 TaxID=2907302 RepID=UPI001F254F1E|nr:histidine kinase [Dyadobacter sp. CY323]MCE6989649.1 histidine kinase [Dyadobacter sp. CY323]